MNRYEKEYRQLLANGAIAWAGEGYFRAKEQQERVFSWLHLQHYFPQPGAPVLELGCGNGAMAAQYLRNEAIRCGGIDVVRNRDPMGTKSFSASGSPANFFVGDVCHIHQCQDATFELIVDGSCVHCLIDDARHLCFAEVRRLLKPGGRLVIGSMCGTPRHPEDILAYDPIRHHLLKEGKPWRTLRPLQALLDEIRAEQFTVLEVNINENAWWIMPTVVCRVD
ncbi:type 11 methyltransferase [Klebsiella michiganensis]|uniref:Type 11 methyltransferase n=1 Tax=Klebsiella michiganensis TaxID=1134687 RepID=A0A7H4MZ51_9ENTR|nr:type 11 methyltransferase [Klebsiella michiganensis]